MSGLDAFLATLTDEPIQPDEWTVKMAYDRLVEKGEPMTFDALRNRIIRQANNGNITSRMVTINSTRVRVYRATTPPVGSDRNQLLEIRKARFRFST